MAGNLLQKVRTFRDEELLDLYSSPVIRMAEAKKDENCMQYFCGKISREKSTWET
jgi:hypothetical protein